MITFQSRGLMGQPCGLPTYGDAVSVPVLNGNVMVRFVRNDCSKRYRFFGHRCFLNKLSKAICQTLSKAPTKSKEMRRTGCLRDL